MKENKLKQSEKHARPHGTRNTCQKRDSAAANRNCICPVFGQCGGCSLLDVPYEKQLAQKQEQVRDLFATLAKCDEMLSILGMDNPYHYRNKVISPYAPQRKTRKPKGERKPRPEIATGMYVPGTHKLIPTDTCAIENETAKRVTLAIRDIMRKWDMQPYDEDTGEGFVRHAVVRVGHTSGEVLVTLVTNSEEFPASKSFCRELVRRVPQVTTVVQNVNTRHTNVILGQQDRVLYGPGFILDTLCGLSFRISSQSFYQVNASQTEVLYNEAIRLTHLTGSETVIDAYCGTGTIGLIAATRGAKTVIGADNAAASIRDAMQNARHNGVENAEFHAADATAFLQEASCKRPQDSLVLVMDPPRSGSTPEFLDAAARLAPKRIVYISCNPVTQARDATHLLRAGYTITALRPVDMFPHTAHVECIALFERKG